MERRQHDWLGPRGEMMNLSGLRQYRRLDEMLADPNIDLMEVCNPRCVHPVTAMLNSRRPPLSPRGDN